MQNYSAVILIVSAIVYAAVSCITEAFESISGGRIRKIEDTDPELAERLEKWQENEDYLKAFSKILLFIASACCAVSLYVAAGKLSERFSCSYVWLYAGLVFILLTVLCGICEFLNRIIALKYDLAIVRFFVPSFIFFSKIVFAPLKPLYIWREKIISKLKSENTEGPYNQATVEDEILDMMEDEPDGNLEEGEKRMIKGIFELSEKSVKEIMTPRVDMTVLPITSTALDARKLFIETGHSRIPVYGRSIDEIKGVIYAKDFLQIADDKAKITRLVHQPIFIPETKAVDELLEEIKRTHNHFAVIIDEYGGTSGVVTFEDIIEEIVGDIRDEYDGLEDVNEKPQLMPDGSVMLEARTSIKDVNDILNIEIPEDAEDEADTIGGYICSALGRIPEQGETFTLPGYFSALIVKADSRKIMKIKLTVLEEEHKNE